MTFQNSKISSGINVVTFDMPYINSVSINIIVKVGSRYETELESGISHFLEHMAFKGTKNRSAEKIAEEFDSIGGHFNAYTSREHTVYYTKVLEENLELALDILADILQNSLFSPDEIKKELNVITQEVAGVNDNPDELVYERFYSTAFPNQSMGNSILGNTKNLETFMRENFLSFTKKYYTAENIVIAIAGNIKHIKAIELSEKYFIKFPLSGTKEFSSAKYVGGFKHIPKTLEQTSLALGYESVPYTDIESFYHAQILSIVLGGGVSSRLFQRIREDLGLAYSVGSFNSSYRDCGIFSIYAGTDHDNVQKLFDNIQAEILKIQEHIDEKELKRAVSQIKTNILMAEERSEYKSEEIGKNFALFGRYYSNKEVLDTVFKTTVDHLIIAAKKIFASNPTLVTVGKIPKNFDKKFRQNI